MEPKQDDYIPRAIEKTLAATAVNFPVTMVCGPHKLAKPPCFATRCRGKAT